MSTVEGDDEQQKMLERIKAGWSANRRAVYDAVVDLNHANKQASRKAIADASGKPLQIVDDHCRNLKEEGFIRPIMPGIFEPVEQLPDRPISGTILPNGRYKLEVGDQVLDLSMREARNAGLLLGGIGIQFGRY